jgi:hypothetical protein
MGLPTAPAQQPGTSCCKKQQRTGLGRNDVKSHNLRRPRETRNRNVGDACARAVCEIECIADADRARQLQSGVVEAVQVDVDEDIEKTASGLEIGY